MSEIAERGAAYLAQRRAQECEWCARWQEPQIGGIGRRAWSGSYFFHWTGNSNPPHCTASTAEQVIGELVAKSAEDWSEFTSKSIQLGQRIAELEAQLAEARKALGSFPRKYESTICVEAWVEENEAALDAARGQ